MEDLYYSKHLGGGPGNYCVFHDPILIQDLRQKLEQVYLNPTYKTGYVRIHVWDVSKTDNFQGSQYYHIVQDDYHYERHLNPRLFEDLSKSIIYTSIDNLPQNKIIYFGGYAHIFNMIKIFIKIFGNDIIKYDIPVTFGKYPDSSGFDLEHNRVLTIPNEFLKFT